MGWETVQAETRTHQRLHLGPHLDPPHLYYRRIGVNIVVGLVVSRSFLFVSNYPDSVFEGALDAPFLNRLLAAQQDDDDDEDELSQR